jgi:hypothetical protein
MARWSVQSTGLALLLAAVASLGATCTGGQLKTVRVDRPREGFLVDDPSPLASIDVTLDGVSLTSALGLIPPFQDQGGAVVLPSGTVQVSGFTVKAVTGSRSVTLAAEGLALGGHEVEISAVRTADLALVTSQAGFRLVTPLALAAEALPAAARSLPAAVGATGVLAHQTGGEGAAGVASNPGGSQLRAGFTPVAEALITAP